MKKYYLFLIILLALKCSIIAQKVEPSRTYNLIEKCYCTSFKQGEKLYNGTIVYVCTKCGKETMANPNGVGGTIEDIIEQNKREAKLAELMKNPSQASNAEAAKMLGTIVPSTITKQQEEAMGDLINQSVKNQEEIIKAYEEKHYCLSFNFVKESGVITKSLIYECKECGKQVEIFPPDTIKDKIADNKRTMEFEKAAINAIKKSQNVSNQQKPTTTSKPSTTTKKQQTNANKSKSINSEKIEKNRQIAQTLNSITNVDPGDPIDHPFKSLEEARSVAYEMMAQKMEDDGTIEYSTGIVKEFDPHFGDRYYIQRIIEGNNKTVKTVTINEEALYTKDSMTGELEVFKPKKVTIEKIHSHPNRGGSGIRPSMGDYKNVINTSNEVKENVSSVIFGFYEGKVSNQALIFYPDGSFSNLEYNGDWKAVNPNADTQYLGQMCDDVETYLYFAGKTDFHGAPCPLPPEGDKTPFNNNNSAISTPKNSVFGK